jgi:RHS repeat-associated protein
MQEALMLKHYSQHPVRTSVVQVLLALALLAGLNTAWASPEAKLTPRLQGGTAYLNYDHRGALVMVTDTIGRVVETRRYGAYGRIEHREGDSGIARGYTGKVHDLTGLVYFGYRYYSPELARWISPDPLAQFASPYLPVHDAPTTYVDSTGGNDDELYLLDGHPSEVIDQSTVTAIKFVDISGIESGHEVDLYGDFMSVHEAYLEGKQIMVYRGGVGDDSSSIKKDLYKPAYRSTDRVDQITDSFLLRDNESISRYFVKVNAQDYPRTHVVAELDMLDEDFHPNLFQDLHVSTVQSNSLDRTVLGTEDFGPKLNYMFPHGDLSYHAPIKPGVRYSYEDFGPSGRYYPDIMLWWGPKRTDTDDLRAANAAHVGYALRSGELPVSRFDAPLRRGGPWFARISEYAGYRPAVRIYDDDHMFYKGTLRRLRF